MSYTCYVCKQIVLGDVRALFSHLRSVHFVCELRGVTLRCGQGDCVRCYSSFNSLARHLRTQHSDPSSSVNSHSARDDSEPHAVTESSGCNGVNNSVVHDSSIPTAAAYDSNSAGACFVASLMSSSVTQKTVQSVIEHTTVLVSDLVQDIANDVINTVKSTTGKEFLIGTPAKLYILLTELFYILLRMLFSYLFLSKPSHFRTITKKKRSNLCRLVNKNGDGNTSVT